MTVLWKHQEAALSWLDARIDNKINYGLFSMKPATGKTLTTLMALLKIKFNRALVLQQNSALKVWANEARKHLHDDVTVVVLQGTTKQKLALFNEHKDLPHVMFVTNYEGFWRRDLFNALDSTYFDVIIADEAHNLKNPTTKQAISAFKLSVKAGIKLALTGTAFHNGPLDIYGIAKFLDRGIFNCSWSTFKSKYAFWSPYNRHVRIGYQNLDELREIFDTFSFTVERDVLDLPPMVDVVETVNASDRFYKIYKEFESDYVARILASGSTIKADNVLTLMIRQQELTSGVVTDHNHELQHIDNAKRERLRDLLEQYENEPVVIFYRFNVEATIITDVVSKLGRKFGYIRGGKNEIDAFQAGEFDTIIVQHDAGNAGIDLSRAHTTIFFSTMWSMGDLEQAKIRTSRPNNPATCTYHFIVVEGTIDEDILKSHTDKKVPIRYITDKLRNRYGLNELRSI